MRIAGTPAMRGATGDLQVINIYMLYEPATMAQNPGASGGLVAGGSAVVGYIYVTVSGQYFVQSTGADPDLGNNLLNLIPITGAFNASTTGTISPPLTPQQANNLFKAYPIKGVGKGTMPCFKGTLPRSQWT